MLESLARIIDMKFKTLSALAIFFIVGAANADMMDGPASSTWLNQNKATTVPTAGRFLPVIEASGPGSTSPFIRMQFCRWNGNQVMVNGRVYTIPSGSCTSPGGGIISSFTSACLNKVCGTSLTFPAAYYVGLYDKAGVLTMNFWPVGGPAGWIPGANGLIVKSDDATTTVIGLVYLNGTQTMDGSNNKQNSVSVFNKVRVPLFTGVTGGPFSNTTLAEVNSNNRLEWVSIFGDEAFTVIAPCTVNNSTAANQTSVAIGIDSTTSSTSSIGTYQSSANGSVGNATAIAPTDTADGHHFAALLADVSSGTTSGTITSCTMMTSPFPS